MVMDSLRHWVEAYHVDGFRFDLAPALARDPFEFSDRAGFLRAVGQDPVLSRVKLIAEPWDVGEHGYRLGQFPPGWSEWNDQSRDTMRAFWRGDVGRIAGLARALTGSREIFQTRGRQPWASIQYVCSHDGFTLDDLVSYNERHNDPNKEGNKDGHPHNLSWNCGVEGPTKDRAILALRAQQKRNLLATVFFSVGVPMLLMGDECSRTQNGNNNAYCQDNETSWLDWERGERVDPDLVPFIQLLVGLRRRHDVFRRRRYLAGTRVAKNGLKDVYWLAPEGREMTEDDWGKDDRHTLGMQIGNDSADGQRFLVLLNAFHKDIPFKLDPHLPGTAWTHVFDTREARGHVRAPAAVLHPGGTFSIRARSLALFQLAPT
jgi:glycogen operon protein